MKKQLHISGDKLQGKEREISDLKINIAERLTTGKKSVILDVLRGKDKTRESDAISETVEH